MDIWIVFFFILVSFNFFYLVFKKYVLWTGETIVSLKNLKPFAVPLKYIIKSMLPPLPILQRVVVFGFVFLELSEEALNIASIYHSIKLLWSFNNNKPTCNTPKLSCQNLKFEDYCALPQCHAYCMIVCPNWRYKSKFKLGFMLLQSTWIETTHYLCTFGSYFCANLFNAVHLKWKKNHTAKP